MSAEDDAARAERYQALQDAAKTIGEHRYRRRELFSMLTGISAALGGFGAWRWIQGQQEAANIPSILRDGHEFNERLWRRLFREDHLAPTYDRSASSMLRVNGRNGIRDEIELNDWQLNVQVEGELVETLSIDPITDLPKVEMTVEHKCVEGWSHVVTWGGARFSDFLEMVDGDRDLGANPFVALWTPDRQYYVGMDMETMMHPQTLLAWELEGEPLTQPHGAPLRLVTPLKYGIKQLKRIGTIEFTTEQPRDYWYERGYDWYAHL